MSDRLLAECQRIYGNTVDNATLESWVSAALNSLLTEETRVTQFVFVLALRDIAERANRYEPEAA